MYAAGKVIRSGQVGIAAIVIGCAVAFWGCSGLNAADEGCIDTFNKLEPSQQESLGSNLFVVLGGDPSSDVRRLKATVFTAKENTDQCLLTLSDGALGNKNAWQFTFEKDGKGSIESMFQGPKKELDKDLLDANVTLKLRSGETSFKLTSK